MKLYRTIRYFSLLWITSCGSPYHESDAMAAFDVNAFIDDQRNCRNGLCETIEVEWQKNLYRWQGNAPTFMVIDSPPFDLLVIGKYAQRTKALLRQNDNGEYIDANLPKQKVSRGFNHFMQEIGSFDNYVPAPNLSEQSDELAELFDEEIRSLGYPAAVHGISTLGFIGEQSPQSPVVVADFIRIKDDLLRSKNYQEIRLLAERAGKTLAERAQALGVKVINMSAGHDRAAFRRMMHVMFPDVNASFDDETEFLKAVRPFYVALANIPGVYFVQAGALLPPDEANDNSSPIDCAPLNDMPNRIRVGYLGTVDDIGIPRDGGIYNLFSGQLSVLSRDSSPCYDAIFNVGYKGLNSRPERAFRVTNVGVEWGTFLATGTSYSAPVATAWLLYKIQHDGWGQLNPADVRTQHIRLNGKAGMFDPLLHGQTNFITP